MSMSKPAEARAATALDPVGVGIMWDRLVAIADEIVSALVRTSFSTIVSESYDLTVAVLDADGELMAQGTASLPVFMGTAPRTLAHMLARFPPDTLAPGDVVVQRGSGVVGKRWLVVAVQHRPGRSRVVTGRMCRIDLDQLAQKGLGSLLVGEQPGPGFGRRHRCFRRRHSAVGWRILSTTGAD